MITVELSTGSRVTFDDTFFYQLKDNGILTIIQKVDKVNKLVKVINAKEWRYIMIDKGKD